MLGQRLAHQPGGAAGDVALTSLTSVALPGLILACLECRQRTFCLRQAGLSTPALPPFFQHVQRAAEQLGLGSWGTAAAE
ncbi:hypothetical protein WJX81_005337 [Elliptochloris bilobata]|uniref:Uncharacterized protein n=1 Tax=Elliptochloris bilobata TaxID=381761 RepID=A0AAW1QZF9_9CHLO